MAAVAAKQPRISDAEISAAGFRVFINITEKWGLTVRQQRTLLGDIPESTFYKFKSEASPKLDKDKLERISCILGIHKSLRILHRGDSVYNIIKRSIDNGVFQGSTPLDIMLGGRVIDLYRVRQFFDGERGW